MTQQRKALHDQVEQIREQDIGGLVSLINRFLHPSDAPAPQRMTFVPIPPGSKAAAGIEEQRQRALSRLRATQSEMIMRAMGDTIKRLRIDLNNVVKGSCSWSGHDELQDLTCSWFEGRVFNRLSMFHLENRRVVTFERCHISEAQPGLIYKVRVLTPIADVERELTVSV